MRTKRLPKRLKWFKKFLFAKLNKTQQLRQEKFQQEFKNILQSCKNPPVVPFSLQLFTSEIYHLFSRLQPLHLTPLLCPSALLAWTPRALKPNTVCHIQGRVRGSWRERWMCLCVYMRTKRSGNKCRFLLSSSSWIFTPHARYSQAGR